MVTYDTLFNSCILYAVLHIYHLLCLVCKEYGYLKQAKLLSLFHAWSK